MRIKLIALACLVFVAPAAAAYDDIVLGTAANSKILEVMLRDSSTGAGKTALAYGDVTYFYIREGTNSTHEHGTCVTMTLDTYADHGFIEIDATNAPGLYQFGVPQAALATGKNSATIILKATGVIEYKSRILIMGSDLRAAALAANMTQVAGQTASAAGAVTFPSSIGTGTSTLTQTQVTGGAYDLTNASAVIHANLTQIQARAVSDPGAGVTAGIYLGHSQPINFNGTSTSAMVKADAEQFNTQAITAAAPVTVPASIGTGTSTLTTSSSIAGITGITFPAYVSGAATNIPAPVNVTQLDGASLSTHAAGLIPADLRNIVGRLVADPGAEVTAYANLGTAQPVNFTGTSTTAYVKTDVTDWKAAAAPAMTGDAFALIGTTGSGLTSLAPSATALSTATWTGTKAGYIDAAISGVGGGSAADVADAVWNEVLSGHSTPGFAGAALAAAGTAADPWLTLIPGAYTAGMAGYILGNNIPTIKTSTDRITSGTAITVTSPVAAGGALSLYAGSDYPAGTLYWTVTGWTGASMSGGTARLRLQAYSAYRGPIVATDLDWAAASITQSGTTVTVNVTLTAAQTALIAAGDYRYQVQGVSSGGLFEILVDARATVSKVLQ